MLDKENLNCWSGGGQMSQYPTWSDSDTFSSSHYEDGNSLLGSNLLSDINSMLGSVEGSEERLRQESGSGRSRASCETSSSFSDSGPDLLDSLIQEWQENININDKICEDTRSASGMSWAERANLGRS